MSDQQQDPKQQINIELPEDVAEGIYSNLAVLTHSSAEFVIDFIKLLPGTPKAKVKSRIILTPQHAKRLHKALSENLSKYEAQHGSISDVEPNLPPIPMNFGGPTGLA